MADKLYRVLNNDESIAIQYISFTNLSKRKQKVKELYPQIETVCKLSEDCDIKITSALKIVDQHKDAIDEIWFRNANMEETFPLSSFMMIDERKPSIPLKPLINFILDYNENYQRSGKYIDTFQDAEYFWEVIWEIVRRREFPEAPSRLESCFVFNDLEDAENFAKSDRRE